MPDSAEWTTTGRRPSASRSRSTAAMFFQFATEETLVPPNLSTTHGEARGRRISHRHCWTPCDPRDAHGRAAQAPDAAGQADGRRDGLKPTIRLRNL